MTRSVTIAAAVLAGGSVALGPGAASACGKTNGCVMDSFRDDYNMMQSGKMNQAILAGRENVEAFKRLQARQAAPAASHSGTRR